MRQKEQWMREASTLLNEHRIEEGLKPYYDKGHFDFRERAFEAKISLVADYLEGIAQNPHKTHMALAQKNKDVVELNELLRGALMSQGKLGDEFTFGREGEGILEVNQTTNHLNLSSSKSAYGKRFAIGDRVMFLSNDHKEKHVTTLEKEKSEGQGVKNGTLGIIESFDLKRQTVEVRLHDGRLVGFNSKSYDALTHGYAVTINKSQGATFDHSYGFFSAFNSNQLLIWLTRHKETFKGYMSKGIASDLKGMVSHVARSDYKGLSTDYDLSEEQKPYFNLVQHYWKTSQEAGNLKTKIDALTLQADQAGKELSLTKEWDHYNDLVQIRNRDAKEILGNWIQCSPFIYQTGVRRETLEVQVGIRQRLLSVAEQAALELVENYFGISQQARKQWKEISQTHPGLLSHNHPDYSDYAKIKAERNELAYLIATDPDIHRPFFKVKEQEGFYVTYHGTVYQQRPQGFKATQEQAKNYITQKRLEAFEKSLKFEERAHYKQVLDYKSLHYQVVALTHHVKEMRGATILRGTLDTQRSKIQEFSARRDMLAYQIVENYRPSQPFIKKLDLKEETLLKHAVLGEVRGMIETYKEAKVIEERTQLADNLVSFALKEQGSVDKIIYSTLKEQNLDLQKLKFEQGWYKTHQEGKDLSIKTIDELDKAYQDLSTYRENKGTSVRWDILKSQNIENSEFDDSKFSNKLERQKQSNHETQQPINTYDREEVLACLGRSHIEGIFARHIDGWVTNPKSTYHRNELRYGSKGGFVIHRDTGVWYNFSSGVGGDIFKYVSHSQNISYSEAIKQIGSEINAPQITQINWEERNKRQRELKYQADLDEKIKIERSQENTKKLYELSQPIEGTIAERYLREPRKIETAKLPEDLRFIPNFKDYESNKTYPALVAFARDVEGDLTSAQVTCLDPHTANKANIQVKKRSLGTIKGSVVEIQAGEGATYIAEGVETALSLKEIQIKGRILASLGLSNMSNLSAHLKKEEPLILCADADDPHSAAWKTSKKAFEKLHQEGFKVSIIRPQGENGRDFNDVLQEEGVKAVQEAFKDVAIFQEVSHQQTFKAEATEEQTISSWIGSTAEDSIQEQEIVKQKLNALELYNACEEELKKLPSIMKAQGEEKAQVKSLNKESLYYAHTIWEDKDLKQQACNLGLESEIQKKAEIYHHDIAWDLNSQKDQENISSDSQENALELYLKCEEKLKNLPSIVVAKGQEKDEVRALSQQARIHAYAVWQDSSLKTKAQELGLEKTIKQKAQIHKQQIEQNIKQSSSFKLY